MSRSRLSLAIVVIVVALGSAACGAVAVPEGNGTLPADMATALVPDIDSSLYVYFQSHTAVPAAASLFSTLDAESIEPLDPLPPVPLTSVAMTVTNLNEFGGTLGFPEETDAAFAFGLYRHQPSDPVLRTQLVGNTIRVARGDTEWTAQLHNQLETGMLVPFQQARPPDWNLLTNLPVSDEEPPLAAGVVAMDNDLIHALAADVGISVTGLEIAFGMVRVNRLAFAVYGNLPVAIPEEIGVEFLKSHDAGIVLVSGTGYPGVGVAFMLRSIAGKLGMETIILGNTNARHLPLEDGHLILKNKGSLVYASLAGTLERAEELMLRALAD